jgi:hypothetical protein
MVSKVIKTRAAPDDELEWIKYGRKLRQDSPDIIDGQAKALVALSTTLLTVYTGALALFKIPDILGSFFPTAKGIWVIGLVILILPIVFWLVSIYLNLNVYQPEAYKTKSLSPNRIKKSLAQIIDAKSKKLKNGMYSFLLALLYHYWFADLSSTVF